MTNTSVSMRFRDFLRVFLNNELGFICFVKIHDYEFLMIQPLLFFLSFFIHDYENWLIEAVDPMGSTTSFEYDANGNMTKIVSAENAISLIQYDENGRVFKTGRLKPSPIR